MPETDDLWERARAAQRADVAAVLARRRRRCPRCGAEQDDARRTCVNCGAELTARYPSRRSRRPLVIAGLILLMLVGGGIPLFSSLRDDAAVERRRAEQRQAALDAAERARLTHDARPVRARGPRPGRGVDPVAHRAVLVDRAEAHILTDARGRVAAGTLDGNIRGVSCSPFPTIQERQAAETAPSTHVGRYDCVAYTSKFSAPEGQAGEQRTGLFGYPYWLVIDYDDAAFVWCKVTPRAGEGGRSLAFVPVPEPCRDPPGPG
jgi:hypothetical protein